MWQLSPPNALLVAGFDGRAENPSIQAIRTTEDPETRAAREEQRAAMHRAIEAFATLFGISLDFARDIESWSGRQWAFLLLPDRKDSVQPVFMIASENAAAANAALQKFLAPWQRLGDVTPQPDSDYPITAFTTTDKRTHVYASASGPVVAFSPSKASLKQALAGGGFPVGSPADKVLTSLSGSMCYLYASPALLKLLHVGDVDIPVTGFGLGFSVVQTGVKVRALGLLTEQGTAALKQFLPTHQTGALSVNPGIPSASLVAASLPDLGALAAKAGDLGIHLPMLGAAEALRDTQFSAALTAVLPAPGGVASAMAASDEAAADKLAKITASLKQMKLGLKPTEIISGIRTTPVKLSGDRTVYLAQIGRHIVAATDGQSLASAAAAINGEQPGVAESAAYKETLAALGDSNVLTIYVNLAPIRGLGFLVDATGLSRLEPVYGALAKSLENLQAFALGAGYDGELASATMFLRARPGMEPGIGPVALVAGAAAAAVAFPAFVEARDAARRNACMYDLKQLTIAAQVFAADHAGRLPTRTGWRTQLRPYIRDEEILRCPSGNAIYGFNKDLSGVNLDKIVNPADVIMFFEAPPGLPNSSGSRADAILPHDGSGMFAYADGHVQRLTDVPAQSHWVPKYESPKKVKKAPTRKLPPRKRPR
jgi:prepilin-type processing-associated H-X9-DG protein